MPMSPRLLRPIASGDPDARRYIAAVQQADGATLEPAVRKAINDFVVGCKQDGIWSAIKASCILMGARTLAGALTPLVGPAPTNFNNNFVASDYNRRAGLVGNGTNKYLDSGRACDADPQDNYHTSVYSRGESIINAVYIGAGRFDVNGSTQIVSPAMAGGVVRVRSRSIGIDNMTSADTGGLLGVSRASPTGFSFRAGGVSGTNVVRASQTPVSGNHFVFATNHATPTPITSRLAFYSIGESINLAALDSRVLALSAAIATALAPNYADPDVNAYITAVELADGGLMLEPGVRNAINDFVTGCKGDGIWSALKASCLLAGPRTLAGILTPLVGTAPTNNNFVSGDYSRKTGLLGDGSTKSLSSNRASNADPQDNHHYAAWVTSAITAGSVMGVGAGATSTTRMTFNIATTRHYLSRSSTTGSQSAADSLGFWGMSRSTSGSFVSRSSGATVTHTIASQAVSSAVTLVFNSAAVSNFSNGRIAFYSIGESLDLALLDARLSAYMTAIGAAIP